jgi:hypothetical protein
MSTRFLFTGADLSQLDELAPPSKSRRITIPRDEKVDEAQSTMVHWSAFRSVILVAAAFTLGSVNLASIALGGSATRHEVPIRAVTEAEAISSAAGAATLVDEDLADAFAFKEALRRLQDTEATAMPYSEARKRLGLG